MRTAVVQDKKTLVIREAPDPVPDEDEVLIQVRYCGVCGSDLHVYDEGVDISTGHEFSGDIVGVGSGVKEWSVGDRVAVEPRLGCGQCFWCGRGETGLCEEFYVRLLQFMSGFATHTKVKACQAHRISDDMSYEHAAIIEPAACALHAIRSSGMQQGDVVAVLGLGPIGQLAARMAKALGAGAVYGTEKTASRIDLARDVIDEVIDVSEADPVALIAELTHGVGADIVIECAGSISSTQQSIALARKGATIVVVGICFDWVHMPVSEIVLKGLTLKGAVCFSVGEFASSLDLVANRQIDVEPLVTRKYTLDNINEAFEAASSGEGGKILVSP
jgi:(R,R)-butanediol dehydrogenase/meso-butanediol dehydrogenase/diacetyl reductase